MISTVGVEPKIGVQKSDEYPIDDGINLKDQQQKIKQAKIRFYSWLSGFFLSIIPLLAIPICRILMSSFNLVEVKNFLSNEEIVFVGISMGITVFNDFVGRTTKTSEGWPFAMIIFVVLGAVYYGIASVVSRIMGEPVSIYAIIFNVAYLCLIFVLGIAKYIQDIWGSRK